MSKKEKLIRICVLGASFSGKSTLCNRFINNNFEWIYEPTIEVGIFRKLINITEDEEHKQYCMMQIEDLFPINHPYLQMPKGTNSDVDNMMSYYDLVLGNKRSGEKKKSNEKVLFKETFIHGYMYIYDMNSLASLEELEKVIEYVHIREEKEAGKKKSGLAAKILVGTKKDICPQQSPIPANKIEQLKKKYNLLSRKVSALTNSEVKEVFLDLARNAMDRSSGADGGQDSESEEESSGFFSFLGCGKREKEGEKEKSGCLIS
ncbi:hypothetical protein SteCoe_33098 [Stentor coeruleus]|uniref:Uncharacterized protein n=1 Tax=Stentor coeruleus TaxID=5963 RepID=A0A1R2AXP2_9CILI|nr:hypothetical protein SteCoe_33098 [Stentor coeruleus]